MNLSPQSASLNNKTKKYKLNILSS